MPSVTDPKQHLLSLFSQKPCWRIDSLAGELHYSIPSVRRFLNDVGYYSSFTHNGGWYTLRSLPHFGTDGLWFRDDIGFSRAGSLSKTLIELTSRSPSGMTAEALGKKLRSRCHAVLVQLCRQGRLERQKQGRSYVYLAAAPHRVASQRQALALQSLPTGQLPAEIAVLVLAEFIKNPTSSVERLAQALKEAQGVTVAAAQIERLFVAHDLKKTLPTAELTP